MEEQVEVTELDYLLAEYIVAENQELINFLNNKIKNRDEKTRFYITNAKSNTGFLAQEMHNIATAALKIINNYNGNGFDVDKISTTLIKYTILSHKRNEYHKKNLALLQKLIDLESSETPGFNEDTIKKKEFRDSINKEFYATRALVQTTYILPLKERQDLYLAIHEMLKHVPPALLEETKTKELAELPSPDKINEISLATIEYYNNEIERLKLKD